MLSSVMAISVAQAVAHTYSVTGGTGRGRVGNTPEIGLLPKPTIRSRNGLREARHDNPLWRKRQVGTLVILPLIQIARLPWGFDNGK